MNSEKVKEIKKGLECCSTLVDNNATSEEQDNSCNECPYRLNDRCSWNLDKDALSLINKLESENETLRNAKVVYETVDYCYEDLKKAQERIAELEEKNKDYYDRLNNLQTYIDNHEEIWKGNTNNALKQFAERLKEITCEMYLKEQLHRCIDETLKGVYKMSNVTSESESFNLNQTEEKIREFAEFIKSKLEELVNVVGEDDIEKLLGEFLSE